MTGYEFALAMTDALRWPIVVAVLLVVIFWGWRN